MTVARTISRILQAEALERAGWDDKRILAYLADLDRIDNDQENPR